MEGSDTALGNKDATQIEIDFRNHQVSIRDISRWHKPTPFTVLISSVSKAEVINPMTNKKVIKKYHEESIGAECNDRYGS